MLAGFWIFGAVAIVIAVVLIILFAVGLTRGSNVRRKASAVGETNVPLDPTESKQANAVADSGATGGNYSRSVPYKQDTQAGTGDSLTQPDRK